MPEIALLLAFFKAMANESRLRIVGLLASRERSVQELAQILELKEPTISHHLAVLKALGLVSVRAEGVVRWHALEPKALAKMNQALLAREDVLALAPKTDRDDDAAVLAAFFDEAGKLKQIPASRKKRLVILRWLVERFDEDRAYPERELNEIIKRYHWDSATLRREMIGQRMMARERSIYVRLPKSEWRTEP